MEKKRIVVLDCDLSNLDSVSRAVQHLGAECIVSSDSVDIANADRLILPGVGAFGQAMENIRSLNMVAPILDYAESGRPILGICLGMQLLMEYSLEQGEHKGLGLVPGGVVPLPDMSPYNHIYKTPHIGYSEIGKGGIEWSRTLLDGIAEQSYMYFVHSFVVVPTEDKYVLARTQYGKHIYCAVLAKANIFGCQFHPEKSGDQGLKILHNFIHNI